IDMGRSLLLAILGMGYCALAMAGRVCTAASPDLELSDGWSLVEEGEAQASIETKATHPGDLSTKYLHISVTKTARPGMGRTGATNSQEFDVQEGKWYDGTFRAIVDGRSVGMVFSLETADGKVLARTTLAEIGRGRRLGGDSEPAATPRNFK